MTRISAEVLLVSRLLLKGRFAVPWHQRYYDWTETQVNELLNDIEEALSERRQSYFLGSIMLVRRGDIWEINDGQQRLITLTLMFAALSRCFSEYPSVDTARVAVCDRMLFDVPDIAVPTPSDRSHFTPRVRPPRPDRSRFEQIIRGRDIGTNGRLTAAWNTVRPFFSAMDLKKAQAYFNYLSEHVELAVLDVPSTDDVNSIFEALNGRGKTLDDLDLIRNHLYSYFADSANEVRRSSIHESIESTLAITRTPIRSEMYFRCFFQCEYGFLHKGRFYRDTRACIRAEASSAPTGDYVYELITRLTDAATVELFRTMTAVIPDKDLLANFLKCSKTGAAKRNLSTFLRELRHYTVTYPLLFSLLRRFVHESDGRRRRRVARLANDFIRDLTSFIMRLSFCLPKFEPSRLEPAIAECSHLITRASDIADVDLRGALCKLDDIGIMHDTRFVDYMSNVRIADARRVKRLLFGISHRFQPDSSVLRIDGCTVEHVLPRSAEHWDGWHGFSGMDTDVSDWTNRVGNFTLLGQGDNKPGKGFNGSFVAKRRAFADSAFHLTREIADYEDWRPDIIHERSIKLAKLAAGVWSFSKHKVTP